MSTSVNEQSRVVLAGDVRNAGTTTWEAFREAFVPVRHRVPRAWRFEEVVWRKNGKDEQNITLGMLRTLAEVGDPRKAKAVLDLESTHYRTLIAGHLVPPKPVLMKRETEVEGRLNNAQLAWVMTPTLLTLQEYRRVLREYDLLLDLITMRCAIDEAAHHGANGRGAA